MFYNFLEGQLDMCQDIFPQLARNLYRQLKSSINSMFSRIPLLVIGIIAKYGLSNEAEIITVRHMLIMYCIVFFVIRCDSLD